MLEALWSAINYIFISGKGFSYDSWAVPFHPGCRNLQGHASGTRAILHSHGTFLGLMLCWKMMIPCLWVHLLNGSFCYLGIIWSWLRSPGWAMTAGEREYARLKWYPVLWVWCRGNCRSESSGVWKSSSQMPPLLRKHHGISDLEAT